MAEHKVLDMVQEILTCSICIEEADDPRQLQCQHTFCCKCLKQYFEKHDKKREIECPVCRKWCSLPNGKVDDLPVSFLYNHLKDAKDQSLVNQNTEIDEKKNEKVPCSSVNCHQAATAFCKTCQYICSECESDHKKVRSIMSHVIITLEEASNLKKIALPPCSKHPARLLELYCETCEIPICLMCYPLNHASHHCVDIIEKGAEAKKQLEDMLGEITMYIRKTDEMTESIENHYITLNNSSDEMKLECVKKTYRVQQETKCIKDAINQDIDQSLKQAQKILESEADKVHVIHMSLKSLEFYGNQLYLYGSPCDCVAKLKSFEERLRQQNPDDIDFNLQKLDTTDAREKISFFQPLAELQQCWKEALLELEKKTKELKENKWEHAKIVSDLQDTLNETRTNLKKKTTELEENKASLVKANKQLQTEMNKTRSQAKTRQPPSGANKQLQTEMNKTRSQAKTRQPPSGMFG